MNRLPVWTRRALLLALSLASTLGACMMLVRILPGDGLLVLDTAFVVVFTALFAWISQSFWTASFGFVRLLVRKAPARHARSPGGASRTALVMPVYNEDPGRVTAALRAMHDSLAAAGRRDDFDIHILSDTNDPETWIAEELAWAELCRAVGGQGRIFYRNRPQNRGRKAGNIADFCERWGSLYDYMIVLDADSVMSGETIIELVGRMDANPKAGRIQVPSIPVGRESLFARIAQFGASAYGAVHASGLAWWQGVDGNYYGHNAILRVAAFARDAGLPELPGRQPLGGEILSHDFVEAALMRRAGWEVLLADDLSGSYEEVPPTLVDYAKRDRRWCQGNLQHVRLLAARGLKAGSRAHLAMGAIAYLASPLWLLLLVISGIDAVWRAQTPPVYFTPESPFPMWPISYGPEFLWLFGATAALLFLPKLYGLALLLRSRTARRRHGGAVAATASVALESLFSVLLAPIMMLFQTSFILATLVGRTVAWTRQRRDDGQTDLVEALVLHGGQTLFGIVVGAVTFTYAPGFFWWVSPVLAGLVLSVPLSVLSSRTDLGRAARRLGLFLVPAETAPDPVLVAAKHDSADRPAPAPVGGSRSPVMLALLDPVWSALHMALLPPCDRTEFDQHLLRGLALKLLAAGVDSLTRTEQRTLLQDRDSVAMLHKLLWVRQGATPASPWLPRAG